MGNKTNSSLKDKEVEKNNKTKKIFLWVNIVVITIGVFVILLLLLLRFCSCSSQERFVIKNHEDINGTTEIAIDDSPELIVHDNKEDIDYTYPDVEFHLDPNSDMIGGLSLSATTGVISGTSITPIDASNVIIAAKFKSQHLLNLLHESSNNVKEPTCRIKIEISEPEENRFEIYNFNQVSGEVGTALTPTNELRTTTNHMVEGGSPDLIVPQSDCIYGISPDISTYGLSFNTATGVISGTPTLGTPSEGVLLTVTVTSTNPLYIGVTPGSDQKHLFIIDSTPTPIELDITCFSDYFFYTGTSYTSGNVLTTKANPGNFTVSDAVYSITPNNLASYGLSFNSSTGEVTGTPTADLSETEYTVSVTSSTYSTCDSNDITFSIIIQTQVISIDCNFTITDTSGNNPVTYDITSITEFNKFCNDGWGDHVNITVEGHTFRKDQLIGINLPTDGMIGGSPLTTIPNRFLHYCTKFVNPFIIPNTVTTIGDFFMNYCRLYNEPITFPVAIASLGNYFMNGCDAFNKPITIPTTIGNAIPHNFLSSQNFNQPISIPSNFTRIGTYFLSNCSSFNQPMIIPNTVTHIDPGLMEGCSSFNSTFTLPTTVDSFTHLFNYFPCGWDSFNQPFTFPATISNIDDKYLLFGSMSFYGLSSFNQPLVFPNYVKGFLGEQIFVYLSSFNQPLDFTTIDNLKYLRCYELFNGMEVFNQPIIGFFDHMIDTKVDTNYIQFIDSQTDQYFINLIPDSDQEFCDPDGWFYISTIGANAEGSGMQGAMSNYFSHNDEYNAPFEFLSANVSYQNPNFQFIPVMLYNCPAFDQQINFPSSILTISPYFLTGDVCFNNGGNDFIFPQTFYQAYDTFNFAYNYKHLDSFNVPVVFPTNYYGNTNGCFGLLNSNLIYNQNIDFSSMNINSIYYQYYDYMTGGPVDDTYSDLSVPADTISMLNFAEGLNYTMLNGFDDISYGGRTYSCSISPVFNSVIDFGTISDFTYNNTEPFTYEGSVWDGSQYLPYSNYDGFLGFSYADNYSFLTSSDKPLVPAIVDGVKFKGTNVGCFFDNSISVLDNYQNPYYINFGNEFIYLMGAYNSRVSHFQKLIYIGA